MRMASTTIAPSTTATSTATSSTPDFTPLTTTFTPPARCTQYSSYGFTMLSSPGYEIWVNEPVPVSSSTVSTCYPSQFLDGYTTTKLILDSTTWGSSVVAAMSPFVCPSSWETVLTAPGNYIACCPPSFTRADPKTTVDGYRPMYGGTCYSDVPYMSVVSHVTQYNNRSVIATIPITATTSGMQIYAHPMDGYAVQQQTIYLSNNSSSASTTATSLPSLQTETARHDGSLSGGAIAGIVIGCVAGVLLLLSLLWFALRRRRNSSAAQKRESQLSGEEHAGTSLDKSAFVESDASPVHEKEGDNTLATELSGQSMPELETTRQPVELDGGSVGHWPMDEKR